MRRGVYSQPLSDPAVPLHGKEFAIRDSPGFAKALLTWFAAAGRDLPWRNDPTPYAVWISEIMLQQTQVKTVLPYFLRWMERFPDIETLSGASSEEILKSWEGLGYYSRAENIRKTARTIVCECGGEFPRTYRELMKLPGIGEYTAGAVMSFAYNEVCPVVDVNIERVLARLLDIGAPPKERAVRNSIRGAALELIPSGKSSSFNQALMELGATVCLPRKPLCPECPARLWCESSRLGIVDQRPVAGKRKVFTSIEAALGVLIHMGKILIQKRAPSGLMPNLWEFPGGKLREGETPEEALRREFREEVELDVAPVEKIAVIRHAYTSYKVTLHAFLCRLEDETRSPVPALHSAVEARWAGPGDLDRYAFPAANRKLIRILERRFGR